MGTRRGRDNPRQPHLLKKSKKFQLSKNKFLKKSKKFRFWLGDSPGTQISQMKKFQFLKEVEEI